MTREANDRQLADALRAEIITLLRPPTATTLRISWHIRKADEPDLSARDFLAYIVELGTLADVHAPRRPLCNSAPGVVMPRADPGAA